MKLFSLTTFLILVLCQHNVISKQHHFVLVRDSEGKEFKIQKDRYGRSPSDWVVKASFHNKIQSTGWAVMDLTTNAKFDAEIQAYGAGLAEGTITRTLMAQTWNNTIKGFCDNSKMYASCKKIHDFIENNINWMLSMIKKNQNDSFWKEVNRSLLQVQGLQDAYDNSENFNPTIRLKPFGVYLLQMGGDLGDLERAMNTSIKFRHSFGYGSCSALIKIVTDKQGKKDLLASHATWVDYGYMLRMVKRYNFGSYSEAFSSYPGRVLSLDDFFIHSSGLVTMETSIPNFNKDLWKFVKPETVPEWLRVITANRLSKNGEEWCQIFSRYNSGTYNNQWMIIDYNQFEKQAPGGILHILEQLPGEIKYDDMTELLLNQTYWASYNVPYFPKIFNDSGLPNYVKKYGDFFTHDKTPRAQIFKRDHRKVTDMDSLIKLMRYNDFKHDPLSRCNCTPPYSAVNAIASRPDLNQADGKYPFKELGQSDHGATDVKATSYALHKVLALVAECGPTHDQQPVFQWSTSPFSSKSHEGHPDRFDFKPELFTWEK